MSQEINISGGCFSCSQLDPRWHYKGTLPYAVRDILVYFAVFVEGFWETTSPKLEFWLLGVFIVQLLGNGRWLSSRGSEFWPCGCVFLPSVKNVWSVDNACLYLLAPTWAGWHYPLQLQGSSMFIVCCLFSKRSERCHGVRGRKGRFRPLAVLQLRFLGWKCFKFYKSFCFPVGSWIWIINRNYFVHTTGQGVSNLAGNTITQLTQPCTVEKTQFPRFHVVSQAGGRPVDLLEELANVVHNNKNGSLTTRLVKDKSGPTFSRSFALEPFLFSMFFLHPFLGWFQHVFC